MGHKILLAHSARFGYPEQTYKEHISEVVRIALEAASKVTPYVPFDDLFVSTVRTAAEYHDLGKVDEANQKVLQGKIKEEHPHHLPIAHSDAGTAHLLRKGTIPSALCVLSHHAGLPSIPEENSKMYRFRVRTLAKNDEKTVREITDEKLAKDISEHETEIGPAPNLPEGRSPGQTFLRFALSCLVDADHSDTARHYGQVASNQAPVLRAADRLELLDAHIRFLAKFKGDERTTLRNEVYKACRDAPTEPSMYACDSPVGTGKTTAVMAHLLRVAAEKGLRRIFVVLPFTNIIDQSVEVYRRALVGIGERPEDIVAAHHHRAEFKNMESRQFAFLWEAPIVVTTAVQFFETLASNHPATLRKLHQVSGSAVFIDEAHAALPSHLWPQAWRWLRELESNWGCHFVLGSGSLNHFWELEEFSDPPVSIPELVSAETRSRALKYEGDRVEYRTRADVVGLDGLMQWVENLEGPRLLIANTVQSAAVIAAEIAQRFGRDYVEHLSTSLCPQDRKATLDQVKARLQNGLDSNWTLVATSCVEAGVDLSFRTAMRERCSLNSLIQISATPSIRHFVTCLGGAFHRESH
jgi:CRISPR-associated endonuclease/helicase Cas3